MTASDSTPTINTSAPTTTTSDVRIDLDELAASFLRDGYVVISGLYDESEMAALETEMEALQRAVAEGEVDRSRFGGDYLTSAPDDGPAEFVHYVRDVTRLSAVADRTWNDDTLVELLGRCFEGREFWAFDEVFGDRFGVVYQDCRSGSESAYSRIGWHSDHQAFPNSNFWPAIAITIHLDATSPANGFLRVVPGSHEWATDAMPLGFEKIAGEIAVYAERGDVILHHCDTWHAAARATEDAPGGIRRHVRGSMYAGEQPAPTDEIEPFNKNAKR